MRTAVLRLCISDAVLAEARASIRDFDDALQVVMGRVPASRRVAFVVSCLDGNTFVGKLNFTATRIEGLTAHILELRTVCAEAPNESLVALAQPLLRSINSSRQSSSEQLQSAN